MAIWTSGEGREMTKSQCPNPNQNPKPKTQNPMPNAQAPNPNPMPKSRVNRHLFWDLVIGTWDLIGIWNLGAWDFFPINGLPNRSRAHRKNPRSPTLVRPPQFAYSTGPDIRKWLRLVHIASHGFESSGERFPEETYGPDKTDGNARRSRFGAGHGIRRFGLDR
jgi:hypothetical protein